jgi:hypothetical protein
MGGTSDMTPDTGGNDGTASSDGNMYGGNNDGGANIGDASNNVWFRVPVDFDIGGLPTNLQEVEQATLGADVSITNPTGGGNWGTPFADLGALVVVHFHDDTIDASSIDVAPFATLGELIPTTSPSSGVKTLDVTGALASDIEERVARGNRSQYRIQFEEETDGYSDIDLVTLRWTTDVTLDVVYLIP